MAQISPIKFERDLQKELFPENIFFSKSKLDSAGAGFDEIQIPIAGDIGEAVVGERPVLPVPIVEREDAKKSYLVKPIYPANPILVRENEEILLTYNKRRDVVEALSAVINTKAADVAATEWGATLATNIVRTSNSTTRTSVITGTTGTRKRIKIDDLIAVRTRFNRMNLPGDGTIYGLLTPDMVEDLFLIDKLVDFDKTGELSKLRNGNIGMVMGMKLMMRNASNGSTGVVYSNASTPVKRTVDEAISATDNGAGIFWNDKLVRRAQGFNKIWINSGLAEYDGGTIINTKVRFGATISRTDEKGVVVLVEAQ